MDLTERFPVSPGKVEALVARLRALGVDARLIDESFTRGGGPGGQKINKTSNRVQLSYPPLGVAVRCQESRSRSLNRFLALRQLADQIEMKVSPGTSKRLKDIDRLRASKARAGRRARAKHKC
ncbi:MAG TPA: peptide chain release factor-like protein [Planctomycetota bacterium]